MKILSTAKATVQGGRNGQAQSSDGHLHVHLSVPKGMGEMVVKAQTLSSFLPPGTQPASSRHLSRWRGQHVEADSTTITAYVGIGPTGRGGFGLEVELHIFIPGTDKATAEQLVALAHEVCLYSNATRGNIPVKLIVEGQPIAAS